MEPVRSPGAGVDAGSASRLILPGRFHAAVFDLDGLLVATEASWSAAEADLLVRHGGVHLPEDELETVGRSVDDSIAVYAGRLGMDAVESVRLRAELIELFLAHLPSVRPMPGALELVEAASHRMRIGVASSSPAVVVRALLRAVGLDADFDVVVTGDDVERNKPAPDAYLIAARLLGVDPGQCVAFEDSTPGLLAATAAGMWCVAVQPDPRIDVSAADLVLDTLEGVTCESGGATPST